MLCVGGTAASFAAVRVNGKLLLFASEIHACEYGGSSTLPVGPRSSFGARRGSREAVASSVKPRLGPVSGHAGSVTGRCVNWTPVRSLTVPGPDARRDTTRPVGTRPALLMYRSHAQQWRLNFDGAELQESGAPRHG